MKGKYTFLVILVLAISASSIFGQNSQVAYHMNLPQRHFLNPALRPSNAVYIGLPALSGININVNNNFINFSDVFMKSRESDSLISFLHPENDINTFLSKIKNKNFIEPEFMVQLFGLGFNAGKSYIFLDINDKVQSNAVIPGDLFTLAFKGNEGFRGDKIDLSALRGDIKYYREIGFGFSREFSSRLRLGVKGKLLRGIATAAIDNRALEINVDNNYTHVFNADVDLNFSAPLDVYMNADNNLDSIVFDDGRFDESKGILDFILGKKNTGFGLDLGATYELTDRLVVSAAVTDIGYIKWKKDITNLKMKSQFTFSGLDMTDVISGDETFDEAGKEMLDSLTNSFTVNDSNSPFTTFLPMGLTLGGNYRLTKSFSVGVLSYSRFIGKQMRESLTMSANLNLGSLISTSISYTAANHRYNNIGAGLAFRTGVFQFYMLTDRIPISWNRIETNKGNNSTILPANWNSFNLRFGMNLVFGNRIKEKNDKPMLICE